MNYLQLDCTILRISEHSNLSDSPSSGDSHESCAERRYRNIPPQHLIDHWREVAESCGAPGQVSQIQVLGSWWGPNATMSAACRRLVPAHSPQITAEDCEPTFRGAGVCVRARAHARACVSHNLLAQSSLQTKLMSPRGEQATLTWALKGSTALARTAPTSSSERTSGRCRSFSLSSSYR